MLYRSIGLTEVKHKTDFLAFCVSVKPAKLLILKRGVFYVAKVVETIQLVCVAAFCFPFPGGDRTGERKKRASEGARLGCAKKWEEVGRGEREGGGGGEKRNRLCFLRSPHPLPLSFVPFA